MPARKHPAREPATGGTKPAAGWRPPVGDEAVIRATGRDWAGWIEYLDGKGCAAMPHRDIVAAVTEAGIGPWWQQSVAVGYERARGLRDVHQTAAGYRTSVSKTIGAPLAALWRAWTDEALRVRWLADPFEIRKATVEKSLRITWSDGTNVEVLFTSRDANRSQVALEHGKLGSAERVEELRTFWRERLEALKLLLET